MPIDRADHDWIFQLWKEGRSSEEIANTIGGCMSNEVTNFICKARANGDRRATRRTGVSAAYRKNWKAIGQAFKRRSATMRRGAKHPIVSPAELAAAIAASSVPVTVCPPGVSVDWRPSWW